MKTKKGISLDIFFVSLQKQGDVKIEKRVAKTLNLIDKLYLDDAMVLFNALVIYAERFKNITEQKPKGGEKNDGRPTNKQHSKRPKPSK